MERVIPRGESARGTGMILSSATGAGDSECEKVVNPSLKVIIGIVAFDMPAFNCLHV